MRPRTRHWQVDDMQPSNTRAIFISLAGNIVIAVAKFAAAIFTGSAAMVSEAVHALADTTHEMLLLLGVRQAEALPDDRHPYGQGKAVYFWGLIAVIVFGVGGIIAINDGWQQLRHPEPVEWPVVACAILVISMVINGGALREALLQFIHTKGEVSFWTAFRTTKDPSMRILILQNALDIVAEALALGGITLFFVTGNASFDGAAGMIIGVTLVGAALWQATQIQSLLIGSSADEHVTEGIRDLVRSYPEVADVEEIATLHMGPECVVVNMRLRFAEGVDLPAIDYVSHYLERAIELAYPTVKYVYVKPTRQALAFEPPLLLLSRASAIEDKVS